MNIVFDLDGTICFGGRPVEAPIIHAISELQRAGHTVYFASARPIRDMLPVLPEPFHQGTLIGGNGALIARGGTLIHREPFPKETIEALAALVETHEATYLADSEWNFSYTGPTDHPIRASVDPDGVATCVALEELEPVVKFLLLTYEEEDVLVSALDALDLVVNRHDHEAVIDMSPAGVTKWTALARLGVKEGTYVAFGNDANDVDLFRHAQRGVIVGSNRTLLPYASEQTTPEGVASVIRALARNEVCLPSHD